MKSRAANPATLARSARAWAAASCVRLARRVRDLTTKTRNGKAGVEHIHRLRAASRRCEAALEAVADHLDPGPASRLARAVRRVRKAAGDVRDLDVSIELARRLRRRAGAQERRAWRALVDSLASARRAPMKNLRAVADSRTARRLSESLDELASRAARPRPRAGAATAPQAAREAIAAAAYTALDRLSAGPADEEALHRLRLALKHLRHTLELRDHPDDQPVITLLTRATDRLGLARDLAQLGARLDELAPGTLTGRAAVGMPAAIKRTRRRAERAARRAVPLADTDGPLAIELRRVLEAP